MRRENRARRAGGPLASFAYASQLTPRPPGGGRQASARRSAASSPPAPPTAPPRSGSSSSATSPVCAPPPERRSESSRRFGAPLRSSRGPAQLRSEAPGPRCPLGLAMPCFALARRGRAVGRRFEAVVRGPPLRYGYGALHARAHANRLCCVIVAELHIRKLCTSVYVLYKIYAAPSLQGIYIYIYIYPSRQGCPSCTCRCSASARSASPLPPPPSSPASSSPPPRRASAGTAAHARARARTHAHTRRASAGTATHARARITRTDTLSHTYMGRGRASMAARAGPEDDSDSRPGRDSARPADASESSPAVGGGGSGEDVLGEGGCL